MDGCTFFPDNLFGIDLSDECAKHDNRYTNKRLTRKQADVLLYRSVAKKSRFVASIMYIGVRIFGAYFYKKA